MGTKVKLYFPAVGIALNRHNPSKPAPQRGNDITVDQVGAESFELERRTRRMPRYEVSPNFRKHMPEVVAGLVVFALMLGLTGWHIGIAAAADGASTAAVLDRNASAVLLGVAFSAMAVFNVAFIRHLRRAYVRPSRLRAPEQRPPQA
jgi:hypothetical protein